MPAAKVDIIIGGSASSHEYMQRLGCLLRKGDGTSMAVLYELVTSAMNEVQVSARWRQTHADAQSPPAQRYITTIHRLRYVETARTSSTGTVT